MKQILVIPETFLSVGYTKDRAELPLEAVRVPAPQPGPDQVLIRVAASSHNPLEYKLAELNFMGRTPPVVLGLDLSGIVVATGSAVNGISVIDAVVAMADLNGDDGWVAREGEGGYAVVRDFLIARHSWCQPQDGSRASGVFQRFRRFPASSCSRTWSRLVRQYGR